MSTIQERFFNTRDEARLYSSDVGRSVKDYGREAPKGKRWSV